MGKLPACIKCGYDFTYVNQDFYFCPDCGHEWNDEPEAREEPVSVVRDAHGNILNNGDTVTIIKDIKVK